MRETHGETLAYETSTIVGERITRPWWVYILVVVYALLLTGILGLAIFLSIDGHEDRSAYVLVGTLLMLLACAASLILVPVRAARRRQMTPISLWIPLLGSATLVGLLAFGGTMAWLEYRYANELSLPILLLVTGVVWVIWTIVFGLLAWAKTPQRIANVLHRWVLAGSVLELLIAVPTHIVVRRRTSSFADETSAAPEWRRAWASASASR